MVNNTNGKDEEIVNKGGEESVDVLESIKLIDMEEYNSLKKVEQENRKSTRKGYDHKRIWRIWTQREKL